MLHPQKKYHVPHVLAKDANKKKGTRMSFSGGIFGLKGSQTGHFFGHKKFSLLLFSALNSSNQHPKDANSENPNCCPAILSSRRHLPRNSRASQGRKFRYLVFFFKGESNMHQMVVTVLCRLRTPFPEREVANFRCLKPPNFPGNSNNVYRIPA